MDSFVSDEPEETLKPAMEGYLFGCELSSKTKQFTFKVDEDDDCEHILCLNTISLGEGAKDEFNVLEVIARNHEEKEISVPVANLRLSCQIMVNVENFELQPPVTFQLKSGSGPVLISGRHIIMSSGDISNSEDEEEDDDEAEEEEDIDDMEDDDSDDEDDE
ncbi:nucleoplasmin-3 [Rhinophrynus dorsalis]